MKVQEIMTPQVEVVSPTTPIRDVARRFRDLDIGAAPVGENDRLVGMITDRDLVVRGLAAADGISDLPAGECMTPQVLYCFDDEPIESVAENMAGNQIRRLPVVNHEKRLVGIVALSDIASALDSEQTGRAVREIAPPH